MYRRGDLDNRKKVEVDRVKKGAFIKLEKKSEIEEKKKTASEKADELIAEHYQQTSEKPTFLENSIQFQDKFEHGVKVWKLANAFIKGYLKGEPDTHLEFLIPGLSRQHFQFI